MGCTEGFHEMEGVLINHVTLIDWFIPLVQRYHVVFSSVYQEDNIFIFGIYFKLELFELIRIINVSVSV